MIFDFPLMHYFEQTLKLLDPIRACLLFTSSRRRTAFSSPISYSRKLCSLFKMLGILDTFSYSENYHRFFSVNKSNDIMKIF